MKNTWILLLLFGLGCSDDANDDTDTNADEKTYRISGLITGHSQQLIDVTVTDEKGNSTTVSTQNLYGYEFMDLPIGTYTLAPNKEGLVFSPASRDVTIVDGDLLDVDFEATLTAPVVIKAMGYLGFEYFNENVFSTSENGDSQLRLTLAQNAIWYHDDEAGLVFTEMSEGFTFSATVKAQKSSDHSLAPDCNVCLGGLMVRNPDDSNGENYVHIVVGMTPVGLGVETKNTINGVSEYTPTNDGTAEYEIQIERNGSTIVLSKRAIGATEWQLAAEYSRPDLPQTIQLGFNIYTSVSGSNTADLSVLFEDVVIDYPVIL